MKRMTIETIVVPPAPLPNFDQVVQGNVDIKQLSGKKYKITFSEIRKFLLYQMWSDSSQQLNEDRKVFYQNAKLWIKNFNLRNDSLKASDKPLFTPTVVMEIGSNKYLFVINQAKLNCKGHVVFKVSTKEIKSSDKKILKLPRGHHDRVRFDIDSSSTVYCYGNGISPSASYNYANCLDSIYKNNNFINCFKTCLSNHPITADNRGISNDGAYPNPITTGYINCTSNCLN